MVGTGEAQLRAGNMTSLVQLYRLLGKFERAPVDDPNCRVTPGGAALDAYLCSALKPTIAYGCTFHPDGSPVQLGDSITEDQVYPYTEVAVARVLADIRRIIKRPLNEYQTAAMCSFVFNVGGRNLEESTKLLPALEAGRWEDAAEALKDFLRAWGKRQHPDGTMKWHRMAERGLLIRRYAEGCLLLGYDWEPWCHTGRISLAETVEWQPNWVDPKGIRTGGRYYDVVDWDATTSFDAIERFAITTPLPPLDLVLTQKAEPAPSVAPASAGQPVSDPQPQTPAAPASVSKPAAPSLSGSGAAGPVAAPKAPQAPTPLPVPVPAKPVDAKPPAPPVVIAQKQIDVRTVPYGEIPPDGKPKNMTDSARVIGLVIVGIGSIVQVLSAREIISTTIGAIFYDLSRDTAFVAMAAGGVAMLVGWATRKRGVHVVTKGMVNATALLK